jgi:hypothetical protein
VYTVTGKPAVWLLGWQGTILTLTLVYLFARVESPCYLVDFVTWEPPADWKVKYNKKKSYAL